MYQGEELKRMFNKEGAIYAERQARTERINTQGMKPNPRGFR